MLIILTVGGGTGKVIIFFTGHGLYFPTTIEQFREKVVNNNKFEWKNIAENKRIQICADKFIFVRDIYKNWCIQGINSRVDTQDKVANMLKEAVGDDKDVVTVGSSAGGYMAVLFGILLGAKIIYTFSPQINLYEYHKDHPINYYGEYCANSEISKYMDLAKLIPQFDGNIFYWYSAYCEEDVRQCNAVKSCSNIYYFAMNQSKHGGTLWGESMIQTLPMNPEDLKNLSQSFDGEIIEPYEYCKQTSGHLKALSIKIGKAVKNGLKRR